MMGAPKGTVNLIVRGRQGRVMAAPGRRGAAGKGRDWLGALVVHLAGLRLRGAEVSRICRDVAAGAPLYAAEGSPNARRHGLSAARHLSRAYAVTAKIGEGGMGEVY